MRRIRIHFPVPAPILALVLGLLPAAAVNGQAITKCQDADGNWHYGTYASEACGNRPITELGENGVMIDVREAPPTVEELQERKRAEQAAREAQIKLEEKKRIDRTLLEKYPSEDVIITLRDQRITELEKQLEFNQRELRNLRVERQALPEPDTELAKQELHEMVQRIERFERAIEQGRTAMQKTRDDYAKLLARYREIDRPQ